MDSYAQKSRLETLAVATQGSNLNAAKVVPINNRADFALESAARARYAAEGLLDELRQVGRAGDQEQPCRSGIDGKLADATDHSDATCAAIQEIRALIFG